MRLRRGGLLLLAAAVGSCGSPAPVPEAENVAPRPASFCRVGPDGGPIQVADRGIGGTGSASGPRRQFDRGIGGTGLPGGRPVNPKTALSAPASGGASPGETGILAVITGFASVCLGGAEVAIDPAVPVSVGDDPIAADGLRAGQVALVDADGAPDALHAQDIRIRFEVSGPVEAVQDGHLVVAGQAVAVTPSTLGVKPAVGDWVSVSGLRRPDGTVEATRLDPRDAGEVLVHGRLQQAGGGLLRIGTLTVTPEQDVSGIVGEDVTATGTLLGAGLQADAIQPDVLATDPAAAFAPGVSLLLVETFATYDSGRVRFGQGFSATAGAGAGRVGRGMMALERGPDGKLRAHEVGPAGVGTRGAAARGMGGGFEAAPVPNHAVGSPGGGGSQGGRGPGGNGNGNGGRAGGRAGGFNSDKVGPDAGQGGSQQGGDGFGGYPGGMPGGAGGGSPGSQGGSPGAGRGP